MTNGGGSGAGGGGERCTYSGCTYEYGPHSPSPIKWDFIASGDGDPNKNQSGYQQHLHQQQHPHDGLTSSASTATSDQSQYTAQYNRNENGAKVPASSSQHHQHQHHWQSCSGASTSDEANAILYHHEAAAQVENCCENYAFSGDYETNDGTATNGIVSDSEAMSVSEAELSAFFDKQLQRQAQQQPPKLNNASDLAATTAVGDQNASTSGAAAGTSATSTSADIVLSRRNNIAAAINQLNLSPDFRHYEKITNLSQQQANNLTPNRFPSIAPGGLNVYNANYCYAETTADKFASDTTATASNAANGGTAATIAANASTTANDAFELFNISGATPAAEGGGAMNAAAAAAATNGTTVGRSGISLTTQNVFETSVDGQQQQQPRRVSVGDGTGSGTGPLHADLLFYDLGDEHAMATWGSVGVNGEPNGAGMLDGGTGSGDALDARVLNASTSGARHQGGGRLRGLFRTVRRRARQFGGKPGGASGSHHR